MRIDRTREPADEPAEPGAKPERPESDRKDYSHLPPNSDLVLPYLSRAAHREEIAALPPIKIEAKPEPATSDASRKTDSPSKADRKLDADIPNITDELGEQKSWPNYGVARNAIDKAVGKVPGTQVHHIVEQSQAKPDRSGFESERINSSDNMVRLPEHVHRRISATYSAKLFGSTEVVRNFLNGTSWDYQHDFGSRIVNDEMRRDRERNDRD